MGFSIRLNEEERMLADSYAKLHAMSLGEAFKRALFENGRGVQTGLVRKD